MSFLDVNIIREKDKFTTYVYRKSTFSGIYTHFDSFLLSSIKIGLLHTFSIVTYIFSFFLLILFYFTLYYLILFYYD